MRTENNIAACLFDLDGTLLDSMRVWADVDRRFLARRQIELPEDYAGKVSSMNLNEAARYTIERFGLAESRAQLVQEWEQMVGEAYQFEVQLKPHAREYLLGLKQRGLKLAVATSLSANLYEPVLARHGLLGLFETFCSTDEVRCGKYRPDVYLLAAERLQVEPASCAVYEDLLVAIASAKQAGMTAYAVYDDSSRDNWGQISRLADSTILSFEGLQLP